MSKHQLAASLARASEDYLKLLNYVQTKAPGTLLEYEQVERSTGVNMSRGQLGRDKLRRAILRSHREYEVIPNVGYCLAKAETGTRIVVKQLMTIDGRVRRAEKAHKVIQDSFLFQMTIEEQKGILFLGAMFGTIRQIADQAKALGEEQRTISGGTPQLPENFREA